VHWFASLQEARVMIDRWRVEYNTARPHGSLRGLTPEEFALKLAASPAAPVQPQGQEGKETAAVVTL
jgi:transposase InsO family protein